jgi:hypothetical protein
MVNLYRKFLSLTCICAVFMFIGATDTFAYGTYEVAQGTGGNCSQCHPGFLDGFSGPLHIDHLALGVACDQCHVSNGDNPSISLNPEDAEGTGCAGCHGRLEDAGNDGSLPGLGAGLRQHHENAGISSCVACHVDTVASYTTVVEAVSPPFYTTLALDPCADNLDNDGDGDKDVCANDLVFGTIRGEIQEGVKIIIWSLNCGLTVPVEELTTDQNGYWEYSGLGNGRWLLNATLPGYSFIPSDGTAWMDLPLDPIKGFDFTAIAD